MLRVEIKGGDKLLRDLNTFAKKAMPYAARSMLNDVAFAARREWTEKQMPKGFTLRNTWTQRSVRVEKATGTNLATMQSSVGSPLKYLARREAGGTEHSRSGGGLPIPTAPAAGQARGAKRTKLVRRPNQVGAITTAARGKGSRRQRNAIAARMAAKGTGFAYFDLGARKVLAKVTGKKRLRVTTLWDVSKRSVQVKPVPTLQATVDAIGPRVSEFAERALLAQLRLHKVLGY